MYDYKARTYSPTLGRFLQTDPIGYQAGLNGYAYAGSDPVNATDPTGLQTAPADTGTVTVTGMSWGQITAFLHQAISLTGVARNQNGDIFAPEKTEAASRKRSSGASVPPGIGHNGPPAEVLVENDIVVTGTTRIISSGVSAFIIRGSVVLSLIIPTTSAGESEEVLRNLANHNNKGRPATTLANPGKEYYISQGVKRTLDAQKTRSTWFDAVKRFCWGLILGIISKFRKALLWSKLTSLYSKGKYSDVTEMLQRAINNRPLDVYEQIIYAGSLAGKEEYVGALDLYNSCVGRVGELPKNESEYVLVYCRFMIAKIKGNINQVEHIKRLIIDMKPPERIQHFVNHNNVKNW